MTYNVLMGTLNPAHSLTYHAERHNIERHTNSAARLPVYARFHCMCAYVGYISTVSYLLVNRKSLAMHNYRRHRK